MRAPLFFIYNYHGAYTEDFRLGEGGSIHGRSFDDISGNNHFESAMRKEVFLVFIYIYALLCKA